jgi:hypothetical protein
MQTVRMRSLLWAVIIGVTACSVLVGLLGMSPVEAKVPEEKPAAAISHLAMQPPDEPIVVIVVFTDPQPIPIYGLSNSTPLGEGIHVGEVRCNQRNCTKSTQLELEATTLSYKYSTRLAVDQSDRRAVVAGTGTIDGQGKKKRFSFTATFQDNEDGSIRATYVASDPNASVLIPSVPGAMVFGNR